MHVAFWGGEEFNEKQRGIMRNIKILAPEETAKREYEDWKANWAWLALKKRG